MASEDYSVQASYKFGPALQNMVNVRADDAAELKVVIEAFDEHVVSAVVNLGTQLDAASGVSAAFGAPAAQAAAPAPATATPAAAPPAAAAPGAIAPCAHGPRQRVAPRGKKWIGFFCPLPKGTPGACEPIFEDA